MVQVGGEQAREARPNRARAREPFDAKAVNESRAPKGARN